MCVDFVNDLMFNIFIITGITVKCPFYTNEWPNFVNCNFWADGNTMVVISGCGACNGDEYLKLLDIDGNLLASNDDGCTVGSMCSSITYFTSISSKPKMYTIAQGCWSGKCSGIVTVTGVSSCNIILII